MVSINNTTKYHRDYPIDLMTEFTICESFATLNSPYMAALETPRPYGAVIGDMLKANNLINPGLSICEVGGGYGNLMAGLLEPYSFLIDHVCMIDLSMKLLKKQKDRLKKWSHIIDFVNSDAMELVPALSNVDVVILNEVIGDLDTWKDIDAEKLPDQVADLVNRYGLDIPSKGTFNFNMGAVLLVEELCKRPLASFISEHSSDPLVPDDMDFLQRGLERNGFPREIKLKEHSEFTIRFSHLVKVAQAWGRDIATGSLIDLVGIKKSPKMKFIFISHACATEEQEIIFELLDHIREYRWLLIK